jgi:hypothetical protein
MKRLMSISSVACFLVAVCGCEDAKSTDTTASTASGAVEQPEPSGPAKLEASEFGPKVVESTCRMLSKCKNDEFRLVFERGVTLAILAALRDIKTMKLDPELKTIAEKLDSADRLFLARSDCQTVGTKYADKLGVGKASLPDLVKQKRVDFDEEKAAACVAHLRKGPAMCEEEKKVEKKPKDKQFSEIWDRYEGELKNYAKCDGVITGRVEEGKVCEYDVECKTGKCRYNGPDKDMTCYTKSKK